MACTAAGRGVMRWHQKRARTHMTRTPRMLPSPRPAVTVSAWSHLVCWFLKSSSRTRLPGTRGVGWLNSVHAGLKIVTDGVPALPPTSWQCSAQRGWRP